MRWLVSKDAHIVGGAPGAHTEAVARALAVTLGIRRGHSGLVLRVVSG
jgi:cytidylate kinase